MRFSKKFFLLAAAGAALALTMPGLAAAHDGGKQDSAKSDNNHGEMEQVRVFNGFPGLFFKGTVTAVSGTGFTMNTKDNTLLTVTTDGAKLIRIPNTTITLANVVVGDQMFVTGTKTGSTIAATVVYDLSANLKPAKAKGTVTANTGGTLTVQTKNGNSVTVNTTADTQVSKNGSPAVVADATVGSKVKLFGLLDTVLNVFNALKIMIK